MEWFEETLHQDCRQLLKGELLFSNNDGLHDVRVYHSPTLGNFLTLDGVVQLTEADEFIYHEMMTHPLLLSLNSPKKILVIGGGDGGILREALKYPSIETIDFVEIDQSVIDLSREFFPKVSNGSFDDIRVNTVITDGAKFAAECDQKYDAVLIDSSDPIGPSAVLFEREFYQNIKRLLNDQGIFIRQTGSSFFQPGEVVDQMNLIKDLYPKIFIQVATVPTYNGGLFTFIVGSNQIDIADFSRAELEKRYQQLDLNCKYYNPAVHLGSFALPNYLKEKIT